MINLCNNYVRAFYMFYLECVLYCIYLSIRLSRPSYYSDILSNTVIIINRRFSKVYQLVTVTLRWALTDNRFISTRCMPVSSTNDVLITTNIAAQAQPPCAIPIIYLIVPITFSANLRWSHHVSGW